MKRYTRIASLLLLIPFSTFAQTSHQEAVDKATQKFEQLFKHIDKDYVDSVDIDKLVEDAINGMLSDLDPHSVYIPPKEVADMNAPLKGNFSGVGIRFQILKDTLMVVQTIPGGPSEKVGVLAGDQFILVDDENIAGTGLKNSGVRDRLLGDPGTIVDVKVKRKGIKQMLDFTIERGKIPIHSLDAAYMATPEIGYVKLNNFSRTTIEEFRTAVIDLKKKGMQDLILDLQGNGGGYLSTAIDLADEFLNGEKLVVYTEGRNSPKASYKTRRTGLFEKGRLIVLVNESSASASEIVSGAIQDWDRGMIVGRRSFGKGLVQRPKTLIDGSMVRLTISRYYTPTGRSIQKSYADGADAYRKEKYDRFTSGEAYNADSIQMPDSLKFETLQMSRVVYGGGGIMPDHYVPVDTSETSEYFSSLVRKGLLNNFSLTYVNANRAQLKANYPTFEEFNSSFPMDKLTKELIDYATKEKLEFNKEDYKKSEEIIKIRLKASVAQNLWDYTKFYEVINGINDSYEKAISILENGEYKKVGLAKN